MRVTKQQAALNRQRIVDSAIKLFGRRGVDSVGVAEVMADAGFTHGGFYNHFTSKEDLVLQACSTSFARSVDFLKQVDVLRQNALNGDLGEWMSAAMLSESSKASGLASVFADGLRAVLDVLTEQFGDRQGAATGLARCVGARVISRAVEKADPELADEFDTTLHPSDQLDSTKEKFQRPERLQASS
ncbi:TetR/AcrR family transcriptional regulator [Mycobacterium sp.]|jgi:TetR/AcrR family transcriptional repressor of nem operon|uniref:TetR/AcrR family transcriptional regulator n=1 Tax=Mycobacterium sp. TaxID=1785 RepID=UPI002D3656E9|nr:TetR family transcriptional regulator [Mycobacterium sp.]HZA11777.1 TetR family transcriptional regulator [Mycobacterium sp.]